MDNERPAYLHPSLEWVCSLPANPADITIEHARAVFQGDVQGVLRDIVNLAYNQHSQLTPITENHDARHETAPQTPSMRPTRARAGRADTGAAVAAKGATTRAPRRRAG